MIDTASAAATLYGSTSTPSQAAAPAQQPSSAAEALYGAQPNTEGMSEGDAARARGKVHEAAEAERALASTYGSAQRAIESTAIERLNLSPDEAVEAVRDWTPRFQQYGLSGEEADTLVQVAAGAIAGNVDQSSWPGQARDALISEFGGNDGATRALDAARALVAKDPALARWLDQTGLGSHPRVVVTLANKARAR